MSLLLTLPQSVSSPSSLTSTSSLTRLSGMGTKPIVKLLKLSQSDRCTRKESHFLQESTNAHNVWTVFHNRHEKLGLVAQVLLIQEALEVQFHHSERLSTMATKLRNLVDHIYAIGIPKQDNFLLILLMNAMSSELTPLCNHVADCINASTTANPYTSAHIA